MLVSAYGGYENVRDPSAETEMKPCSGHHVIATA